MSIYSTVASGVESAAKANGYNIDLGAKAAKSAVSTLSNRSNSRQDYISMDRDRGYGEEEIDGEGQHGREEDGWEGEHKEKAKARGGWDDDEGWEDHSRRASSAATAPRGTAAAAAPASGSARQKEGDFIGFDEGGDDDGEEVQHALKLAAVQLAFSMKFCCGLGLRRAIHL
jgi:hypothetical protein